MVLIMGGGGQQQHTMAANPRIIGVYCWGQGKELMAAMLNPEASIKLSKSSKFAPETKTHLKIATGGMAEIALWRWMGVQ